MLRYRQRQGGGGVTIDYSIIWKQPRERERPATRRKSNLGADVWKKVAREHDRERTKLGTKVNGGGESFPDAFTASPLLAFQLVFRRNLEFTLSRAFGTRAERRSRARVRLYRVRGGIVSPTYERGDKVTLRNCFPQADEGELSPSLAPRPPPSAWSSLPSTKSNSPSLASYLLLRDFFLLHSPNVPLSRARFRLVLLREMSIRQRGEESRIYAKSMREGVLRNRYFVTGEITTSVIRGLSASSRGFWCHYLSRVFRSYQIALNFIRE